jgi:hypothetical protein
MLYPWPIGVDDVVLDESLRIAMDYLERTGQANNYLEVQRVAATTILTAWRQGVRRPIRLANYGIRSVEQKEEHGGGVPLSLVKKTPR